MPSFLYLPLFMLAVIISLSFTEEIWPEGNLFQVDNGDPQVSINTPLASDLNDPNLIAWNDPGVNTLDQHNTDVDVSLWNLHWTRMDRTQICYLLPMVLVLRLTNWASEMAKEILYCVQAMNSKLPKSQVWTTFSTRSFHLAPQMTRKIPLLSPF